MRDNDKSAPTGDKNLLPINEGIVAREVMLIGIKGEKVGLLPLKKALETASNEGMDLVQVSPVGEKVTVCRMMDYARRRFQDRKKHKVSRKKQRIVHVKEIKLRPNIGQHDYDVKMRNMERFLKGGDRVRVTLQFRGREIFHRDIGMNLMEKVQTQSEGFAKIEMSPRLEQRQMIMTLAPR